MTTQRAARLHGLGPILLLAALAAAPDAARSQDAETNILPTEAPTGEGAGPFAALGQSASANLFTGEATLALPLRLPPSRGEVTPQLELSWSSSGGDGPFGHGWSLGLGAIARSKREGVPDCGPEAPVFTLHLPGAVVELVRAGASSSWYARVDEAFVEAVADEEANQWLVRDRAGRTYHFGGAPEARAWTGEDVFLAGGPPPASCSFTAFWALTRIEDPNGNRVDFRYDRAGNAPLIAEIAYGANPAAGLVEHPFRVEFGRIGRAHPQRSRSLGVPQEFGELVDTIRVLYRASASDPALYLDREYALAYEQEHGGAAYLVEVRERAPEGELPASAALDGAARIEVPPRRFEYDRPSLEQAHERFRPDPLGRDSFFLSQGSNNDTRFRVLHDTLDMNGDGIADAVDTQYAPDHWRVLPGTESGFDAGAEILWYVGHLPAGERALSKTRRQSGRNKLHYDTVDLTGDGVPDWVDARETPWLVLPGHCTSATRCQFGVAGEPPLVWPAPSRYLGVVSITHGGRGSVTRRALIDLNGDARPDYVQVDGEDEPWEVYRGTGAGFEASPTPFVATGWLAVAEPWIPSQNQVSEIFVLRRVFDMNGDALPDLVSVDGSGLYGLGADGEVRPASDCPGCPAVHALEVRLNDGRGFEPPIRSALGEPIGTGRHYHESYLSLQFTEGGTCTSTRELCPERTVQDFSDVDGDGLPDYITTSPGNPASGAGDHDFVQRNLGGGRLDPTLTPVDYPGWVRDRITGRSDGHRWTRSTGDLMDLDGDGLLEVVKADEAGGEWCATSFGEPGEPGEPRDRPGLLRAAHDGVGGVLRFRYAPSSRFDHGGADGVEDLPFSRWVVTAIAQSDGLCASTPADPFDPDAPCLAAGHGRLRRFDYADGFFDAASREFRGFGTVWETDAYGNETEHVFSQADHTRGKLVSQVVRAVTPDGTRHDVRAVYNSWQVLPSDWHPERVRVWLAETRSLEYAVPHDPARLLCALSRNEAPDEFGRVSRSCSADCTSAEAAAGCEAVPGQVRTDTVWAEPAAGSHLRERPERVSSWWTDAAGATRLLSDKRMRYDGEGEEPLGPGLVSRGNVRRVESWLDQTPLDPDFAPGWQTPGVRMDYDAFGNLVATTDARGHTRSAIYSDASFAIHPVVERAPDTDGVAHASFVETSLRFGAPTRILDPNGQLTERRYDALGRLVCEALPGDSLAGCHAEGPLGASRELQYHFGVPEHSIWLLRMSRVEVRVPNPAAPAGHNVRMVFRDALGRERLAWVERTLAGDDPAQTPSRVVEGQVDFDAEGRPRVRHAPYVGLPVQDPSGPGATWLGYALGASGAVDPLGRVGVLDPPGPERLEVEHGGRLRVATDASGSITVTERDAFGRSVREERLGPDGARLLTTQRFDGAGRVIERQVGGADGDPATTVFQRYDTLGRRVEKMSPDAAGPWRYGYDAAGNLVYRDDPRPGQHVQQVHDAHGRLLRVCSHADDAFDPAVGPDSCGGGEEVALLRYDEARADHGVGRLTTARDAHGRERLDYDARGRVTRMRRSVAGTTAYLAWAYDTAGRLLAVSYPDSDERRHHYDASGQLVAIDGVVEHIEYDLLGRAERIERSNGVSDTYSWTGPEQGHRLRGIRTSAAGAAPLFDVEYGYDALGKLASIRDFAHDPGSELSSAADLVYDGIGRLVGVQGSRADEIFAFDALGNLLARQGEVLDYAGAGPHQVTAHGDTAIGYTANGERAWKSGPAEEESYHYDALGRLVRIDAGGEGVHFGYDYAGRLVMKSVGDGAPVLYFGELAESRGGVLTKHFHAGDRLLASSHWQWRSWPQAGAAPIALEGDWLLACWALVGALLCGAGLRRRPGGRQRVLAARALGASALLVLPSLALLVEPRPASAQCAWDPAAEATLRHYHVDHLGSTQLVTDGAGALHQQIRYDAYGVVRWREGPDGPVPPDPSLRREFTGYESEPLSGLLHAGARFYDPALGQFLSHDPADQFPSPYAYGPGDPLNGTDPSGALFGIDDLIAVLVIASVLASIASVAHAFATGGTEAGFVALVLAGATAGVGYGVGAAGASVAAGGVIHAAADLGARPLVQVALLGSSTGLAVANLGVAGDAPEALAIASYVLAGISIGLAFAAQSSEAANGVGPGETVGRRAGFRHGGEEVVRVTGGSAAERAKLEADMAEVFGTERGAELLDLATRRSSPLEVRINHRGFNYYDARRDFITVDPTRKIDVLVWKGWRPGWEQASMRRILAHELGHALTGIRDVGPFRLDNIRANENPIVNELGERSRIWY